MPFATVEGSEFYYDIAGRGPPLLLVTGLAGISSYWDPNVAELGAHFTVIRYDHRGTGRSERSEQDYSIEGLTEDLVGLMDQIGIERASFVGHSTGGAIAQVLAAKFPQRVDRIVLYGSWSSLCEQMRLLPQGFPGFPLSAPLCLRSMAGAGRRHRIGGRRLHHRVHPQGAGRSRDPF